MDRIITALDYAKINNCKTVKGYLEKTCQKMGKRLDTPINGKPTGKPVYAELNFGRWIARCQNCKGAEDVEPNEPIFYCFSCGNYVNSGKPRRVIFPKDREEIEKEIMKRPIKSRGGANYLERQVNAIPKVRTEEGLLSRSWMPGETLDEIKRQNLPLEKPIVIKRKGAK